MSARTIQIVPLILFTFSLCCEAVYLPMPRSTGQLSVSSYYEHLDAHALLRYQYSGAVSLTADPLADFSPARGLNGPALSLSHELVSEAYVFFWVYPDRGQTAFKAASWNRLIQQVIEQSPDSYAVSLDVPFEDGESGSVVVAGSSSMGCVLKVSERKSDNHYRYRLIVVPLAGTGEVLVIGLSCREQQFPFLSARFESHVRSLALAE